MSLQRVCGFALKVCSPWLHIGITLKKHISHDDHLMLPQVGGKSPCVPDVHHAGRRAFFCKFPCLPHADVAAGGR